MVGTRLIVKIAYNRSSPLIGSDRCSINRCSVQVLLIIDGYLYGASGQTLMCIEYATGKVMWQDRSIGASSLAAADGKLFLHGENNEVAMVKATHESYQELGRFAPPEAPDHGKAKAWSYPIIVDGKLLVRDVGSVWCYDIRG